MSWERRPPPAPVPRLETRPARTLPVYTLIVPRGLGWKYPLLILASVLAGLLLGWSRIGAQANFWAYDFLLRLRPVPHSSSAILLAIDEDSLETFGDLLHLREPLARALEAIARYEPAAVAIDIVLSEPGEESENEALERALAQTPNVVLAAPLRTNSTEKETAAWQEPAPQFRKSAALGHVHADPDDDGVCRRILLAKAGGGKRLWAMALEAYRLAQGGAPIVETEAGLEIGSIRIPAPLRGERALPIAYPGPESSLERLPLKQVLENPESAARVRGRVVFVGVVVPGGPDQFLMTPFSFGRALSGVEINASAYETLARGNFLRTAPDSVSLAVALAFAAGLAICFVKFSGRRALWLAGALLAGAHLVPAALFLAGHLLDFALVGAVAWLCFFTGGGFHYLALRGRMQTAEEQRSRYQRAVHYVTHEMRTPLTTIQGSSEIISRYALTEEKRQQMAGLIYRESVRLAKLVDMFLSVEKLSAGELALRCEAVRADEILAVCLERAQPLAERKQISIRHEPGTPEPLWADREFLEYACYNLITNAIKYSPPHSAITVRAWHDQESVLLSVEDRGYGMDAAELKNIFRRFYRTPRAEKSDEKGTGLGLAIVEEIVVQHGGSIAVESRIGEGSRFTLSLPRAAGRALKTA